MPLEITERQLEAFDNIALARMVERICTAAQAARPDLCAEAAEQHPKALTGFVTEACMQAYDTGLNKGTEVATFAAICLAEQKLAARIPNLFTFIEDVLDFDEPGYELIERIDDRIEIAAATVPDAAELAGFVNAVRKAI